MDINGPLLLQTASLLCYGIGAVMALRDMTRPTPRSRLWAPAAAGAGLLATAGALAWRGLAAGRWNWVSTADEALLALSACAAFVFLFLSFDSRLRSSGTVFLPAIALIVLSALVLQFTGADRQPVGPGALMAAHMLTVVGAATAYTSAFVGGALYLAHAALLQRKRITWSLGRLPALETLERFNYLAAAVGFPLLTIAVLTGFLAFGRPGAAEPGPAGLVKIALAVAVWLAYGLLMAFVPRFRAGLVARLNVIGFFVLLAVLLTAKFAFN